MVHGQEDLAGRIQRLERDARRWRLGAVALAGVLGMVGLVGATTAGRVPIAEEIRARRFVLVDEAGRERARLTMEPAYHFPDLGLPGRPTPRLVLYDEEGGLRVRLHEYGINFIATNDLVGSMGAVGFVFSERGKEVATLDVDWKLGPAARPSLTLRGEAPSVVIADEEGHARAALGYAVLETAKIGAVEQRPPSSLILFAKDGKALFKAP